MSISYVIFIYLLITDYVSSYFIYKLISLIKLHLSCTLCIFHFILCYVVRFVGPLLVWESLFYPSVRDLRFRVSHPFLMTLLI